MNTAQSQAEELFSHCFTKEQLGFLRIHPAFIEMTRNIQTPKDANQAVELGGLLVRLGQRRRISNRSR